LIADSVLTIADSCSRRRHHGFTWASACQLCNAWRLHFRGGVRGGSSRHSEV